METKEHSTRSKKKEKLNEPLRNVEDVLGKDQSSHPSPCQSSCIPSQKAGDGVVGATGIPEAARASSVIESETGLPLHLSKEVKAASLKRKYSQLVFFPKKGKIRVVI